jgi:hypothetical protein
VRRRNAEDVEKLSLTEVYADLAVRHHVQEKTLDAARLAEEAGLDVTAEVVRFEDLGDMHVQWVVRIPKAIERKISLVVWDRAGKLDYSATRSTTKPGWQLTSWDRDGEPWGHTDLKKLSDAFPGNTRFTSLPLQDLAQIVFADGRVLVRRGFRRVALNPGRRRAVALSRRLANP